MTRRPPARHRLARRPWGRSRVVFGAAAVAALVLAACGLAEDGDPELLAVENVPYDLLDPDPPPPVTAPPSAGTTPVTVFFIEQSDDGPSRLYPTEREVHDAGSVTDRFQALLEGPSSNEIDDGATTFIPSDTTLSVERSSDSREVVVELSQSFFDSTQGPGQRNAFAQLTCTATEVPGVSRVSFLLDGEPVGAAVADGSTKEGPVSCRADYLGYQLDVPAPDPQPTFDLDAPFLDEPGGLDEPFG